MRVVAGPSGQIKEIDLRFHALELSGAELGDRIGDTIKEAGRKADRGLAEEVGRLLGQTISSDPFNPAVKNEEQDQ